jgi:serine/threonine-protein kinase
MIGKVLAQYEIESRLGAGGMGEVYQARDTRLGRSVAVKLLPEVFARDEERIARFQREAKVLASLNHHNIAALHGLEQFENIHFLVMELVGGDTLAERLRRGPMPPDEALKAACQIAEALEAAHEKSVVHRDLKPANVKITPEGKVKVLDFGLAKAMDSGPSNVNLSNSPTLSMAGTNAGVILGTAAYMSPEQANGFTADTRSDIFSFGAVLYEMLSGRQAFQGQTISEILASVLAREPDFSLIPSNLNPRIFQLLRRCLEKNPKRRWQAIGDVRVELEAILAEPRSFIVEASVAAAKRPLWKRAIPIVATAVLFSVVAAVAAWNLKPSPPVAPVARFPFTLPEGQQFTAPTRQVVSISPDGTQFVYVANNRLYLKPMRELQPIAIQGTESLQGVLNPVFSPDGQSLAFYSVIGRSIQRIAVSGGAPVQVCVVEEVPFGMSWGENDEIVFGQGTKGIMRVSAKGGQPVTLVSVKNNELVHGPQILPGGKAVLFTSLEVTGQAGGNRWDKAQIVVQPLPSGERITLEIGSDARYVPTGHIIYELAGTLLALPFDAKRLKTSGGPVPIVQNVRVAGFQTGTAQFSFSNTGSLVYVEGGAPGATPLSLMITDRNGKTRGVGLPPAPYQSPRFSPDGKQLALVTADGRETFVSVYDMSGKSALKRLTFGATNNLYPLWSGDGQRILFTSAREGDTGVWWQRADGTGVAERITKSEPGMTHAPESWSKRDDLFAFTGAKNSGADNSIWTHSLKDKKSTLFYDKPGSNQHQGHFSPDGQWMVYESNESGASEIYVQPFPPTGAISQITKEGGNHPVWSPDEKELFYVNNDRLFSVSISTTPTLSFSNPMPLPITGFVQNPGAGTRMYDTHDGQQFIMLFRPPATDSAQRPEIQVVLNWFEELKQRVGSR